jgi:hypothetical protein
VQAKSEIEAFTAYLERRVAQGWHVVRSEIENSSSNPLTLIAEPYGVAVTIPPGGKCEIVAEEPSSYAINISVSDSYIQIWANGIIEIFQDGEGYGTTSEFLEWRREWQERTR